MAAVPNFAKALAVWDPGWGFPNLIGIGEYTKFNPGCYQMFQCNLANFETIAAGPPGPSIVTFLFDRV